MTPVLIYTDTEKITAQQNALANTVPLFQSVYTGFKAINITCSLQEINTLLQLTLNRNGSTNFVQEFAINKLLDAAAPYVLNGVSLSRDKVRDMMILPDVTAIVLYLNGAFNVFNSKVRGARIDLLTLADDVVSVAVDADTTIATALTFYTLTDASTAKAISLQAVCDALNAYDAANGNVLFNGVVKNAFYDQKVKSPLVGITTIGGIFGVSLSYIRAFEATTA